jgi:ribosomal-protein-alanine N-acetyltransferase
MLQAVMRSFSTSRLVLRPLCEDDAELLFRLNQDEEVARLMPRTRHTNITESQQLLDRLLAQQSAGTAAWWTLLEQGRPIGTVGFPRINRSEQTAQLAYELVRDRWGLGLAQEAVAAVVELAFGELELVRIVADVDELNVRSARLAERLGFVCEKRFDEIIDGEARRSRLYVRVSPTVESHA